MSDETPTVDLGGLTAEPVQPLGDFGVPDHTASAGAEVPPAPPSRGRRLRSVRSEKATGTKADAIPVPDKPRPGSLTPQLEKFYAGVGMALLPFDEICGQAVLVAAPECAAALENLARENPAVRRVILRLVETTVWGQVAAAHMPILIAVLAHHGKLNPMLATRFGMEIPVPYEPDYPPEDDQTPREHVRA